MPTWFLVPKQTSCWLVGLLIQFHQLFIPNSKNRFTLSNLTNPKLIDNTLKNVDWSFFGTAHGKGPVDGVGGTVKRAVWRRILQKQVLVNTARDFANVAERACPNIRVIFISKEDVGKVEKEFQEIWDKDEPKNIPNIRNAHFFRRYSVNELEKSVVTPYFQELQESIVFEKVLIFSKSTAANHQSSSSKTTSRPIQVEQYFAVDYIDRFYIGRTIGLRKPGFWRMKFLHQTSLAGKTIFNWPRQDDFDVVHESSIFGGPVTLDGVLKDFSIIEYKDIEAAFKTIKAERKA